MQTWDQSDCDNLLNPGLTFIQTCTMQLMLEAHQDPSLNPSSHYTQMAIIFDHIARQSMQPLHYISHEPIKLILNEHSRQILTRIPSFPYPFRFKTNIAKLSDISIIAYLFNTQYLPCTVNFLEAWSVSKLDCKSQK